MTSPEFDCPPSFAADELANGTNRIVRGSQALIELQTQGAARTPFLQECRDLRMSALQLLMGSAQERSIQALDEAINSGQLKAVEDALCALEYHITAVRETIIAYRETMNALAGHDEIILDGPLGESFTKYLSAIASKRSPLQMEVLRRAPKDKVSESRQEAVPTLQ